MATRPIQLCHDDDLVEDASASRGSRDVIDARHYRVEFLTTCSTGQLKHQLGHWSDALGSFSTDVDRCQRTLREPPLLTRYPTAAYSNLEISEGPSEAETSSTYFPWVSPSHVASCLEAHWLLRPWLASGRVTPPQSLICQLSKARQAGRRPHKISHFISVPYPTSRLTVTKRRASLGL